MSFLEICNKEVVQIQSGVCLGRVDDLELDPETANIKSFVMLGRPKLFGLLGREESLYIPWHDVIKFGIDAVLINTELPERSVQHKKSIFSFIKESF